MDRQTRSKHLGADMIVKLKRLVLLGMFAACLAGCAPKELFSCCDRHCFLADWTNHHSCVSCCPQNNCCQPPIVDCSPECR
jgi:hypothetical protein